jgi:hypothetical protein
VIDQRAVPMQDQGQPVRCVARGLTVAKRAELFATVPRAKCPYRRREGSLRHNRDLPDPQRSRA